MAFDKVIDSAQLDAGLTTIANAIREKAGVNDNFAFPAGFAEAIAAIEAGGGGGIAYGTIQTSTDTIELTITHDLGIIPDIVFYWQDKVPSSGYSTFLAMSKRNASVFTGSNSYTANCQDTSNKAVFHKNQNSLDSTYSNVTSMAYYYPYGSPYAATTTSFRVGISKQNFVFTAGVAFHWVALGGLS